MIASFTLVELPVDRDERTLPQADVADLHLAASFTPLHEEVDVMAIVDRLIGHAGSNPWKRILMPRKEAQNDGDNPPPEGN